MVLLYYMLRHYFIQTLLHQQKAISDRSLQSAAAAPAQQEVFQGMAAAVDNKEGVQFLCKQRRTKPTHSNPHG